MPYKKRPEDQLRTPQRTFTKSVSEAKKTLTGLKKKALYVIYKPLNVFKDIIIRAEAYIHDWSINGSAHETSDDSALTFTQGDGLKNLSQLDQCISNLPPADANVGERKIDIFQRSFDARWFSADFHLMSKSCSSAQIFTKHIGL